jgi:hypothetical protein
MDRERQKNELRKTDMNRKIQDETKEEIIEGIYESILEICGI